jgi:hypothetical protein
MRRAACTGSGLDFVPDTYTPRDVERAIAVCQSCPVRDPCLAFARASGAVGVWGARYFGTRAEHRARADAS